MKCIGKVNLDEESCFAQFIKKIIFTRERESSRLCTGIEESIISDYPQFRILIKKRSNSEP